MRRFTTQSKAKKIIGLIKRIALNPRQKDIHDLRILTREMRALIWLIEKKQTKLNLKPLKKELKSLSNDLGRCREWDVLYRDAKSLGFDLDKIKKNKKKQHRKLQKKLPKKLGPIAVHLKKLPKELKLETSFIAKSFHQAIKRWPHQLPNNKKDFHQLRISLKKLNYRMQLTQAKSALPQLQKQMGRLHDYEILHTHYPTKKIKEESQLKSRCQKTYTNFLKKNQ